MLSEWQDALIATIRSAITGQSAPLSADFLTDEILTLATQQQIIPIVYFGALDCGVSPQLPMMKTLLERTVKLISIDESQSRELLMLRRAFDENGIDYMLLKGSILKEFYPRSEMRAMSDADVLIRTEQYEKIKPIMRNLGFCEGIESDHELHWEKPTLHLELHKRLIPSYNQDYCSVFGEGWDRAKRETTASHSYQMSVEDTYLYLFTHFAKHYRDGGIGAKHLIDLWLYRKACVLDEAYVQNVLQKLNLTAFYQNVCAVARVWFENEQPTELTDYITNVLLSGGAYGRESLYRVSWALRISGGETSGKKVRHRLMRQNIFLPYWRMCLKYPFLKKFPFLLPIMWPVRWVSALLFRRDTIRTERESAKELTTESIEEYRDSLECVGLRYENEGNG